MKLKSVVAACALSMLLLPGILRAQTRDVKTEEANKKLVITFYQSFFGDHDMSVLEKYVAPDYIQHNPTVADGRDGLANAAKGWFASAPKSKVDIRQAAADGDLVWLHLKAQYGPGPAISLVDIFRVKDGKIVEHWDIAQPVPDKAANPHPMF
jgi:predicted SnoaL-like aldol condensation-catalyzing enzyme